MCRSKKKKKKRSVVAAHSQSIIEPKGVLHTNTATGDEHMSLRPILRRTNYIPWQIDKSGVHPFLDAPLNVVLLRSLADAETSIQKACWDTCVITYMYIFFLFLYAFSCIALKYRHTVLTDFSTKKYFFSLLSFPSKNGLDSEAHLWSYARVRLYIYIPTGYYTCTLAPPEMAKERQRR